MEDSRARHEKTISNISIIFQENNDLISKNYNIPKDLSSEKRENKKLPSIKKPSNNEFKIQKKRFNSLDLRSENLTKNINHSCYGNSHDFKYQPKNSKKQEESKELNYTISEVDEDKKLYLPNINEKQSAQKEIKIKDYDKNQKKINVGIYEKPQTIIEIPKNKPKSMVKSCKHLIEMLREKISLLKSDLSKFEEDLKMFYNEHLIRLTSLFKSFEKQKSDLLKFREENKKLNEDIKFYTENNSKLSQQLSEQNKRHEDYKKYAENEKNNLQMINFQLEKTIEELKNSSQYQKVIEEVKKCSQTAEEKLSDQTLITQLIFENERLVTDSKTKVFDNVNVPIFLEKLSEENKMLRSKLIQTIIFK